MTKKEQIEALLRPEIVGLDPYKPIQPFEVLSKKLNRPAHEIIKLDANENPYGPVSSVVEALAEYNFYHIYSDPQQGALRAALSDYIQVPTDNILATHGADEILDYLCRLFLQPNDTIINSPPTFGMYSFDASLVGAQSRDIDRLPNYSLDVEAICQSFTEQEENIQPKIVFVTSPNNPSGNWLPDHELHRLLALPTLVVLDEAYVEFADFPSRADWVLQHDNLVVIRTFSKAAGIAGLRLGYGICPQWLMDHLWKFKQPYNVNVAATVAGLASLRHQDEIQAVVAKLKAERERLFGLLQEIPYLQPNPSQANFILCNVIGRDAYELKQALEEEGILVRYYDKLGLQNSIRISVGRPEQIERLMAVLQRL